MFLALKILTHININWAGKFISIGLPPSMIITRWSNWLNAAEKKKLPTYKQIVEDMEEPVLYMIVQERLRKKKHSQ